MVVAQTSSTTFTGHRLCFWFYESIKKTILSPPQEAHSQQDAPNLIFRSHHLPQDPGSAHLPRFQHTLLQPAQTAHYFPNTPCLLMPLQYSFFSPDTHLASLFSSYTSISLRLNSNATFSGKFSITACAELVPLLFVSLASYAYHSSRCTINRFLLDCNTSTVTYSTPTISSKVLAFIKFLPNTGKK